MVVGAQALPYNDIPTNLPAISNGSIATGDVNNDGTIDFLILGNTVVTPSSSTSITEIFIGNGNGNVTNVTNPFPGLQFGRGLLIDINNDGNLDVFIIGFKDSGQTLQLPTQVTVQEVSLCIKL